MAICAVVVILKAMRGGEKSRRPVSAWNEDERVKEEGTTDRKVSLLYLPDTVCVRVRYVPLEQVHLLFFFLSARTNVARTHPPPPTLTHANPP